MTTYRLHCFCQSGNAYKVALYLTLAKLDWEPVFVDYLNGATRDPKWRDTVNEMGEVPVFEAGDRKLTQTGVILSWLGEQHGMFVPQNKDDCYEALRWILFDNHKFTSFFATLRYYKAFAPKPLEPDVMSFVEARTKAAYAIVDNHLASRDFMVGTKPTIADLSLAGYVYFPPEESGIDIAASYPSIDRWRARIAELPGWKGPYDLLPGTRIAPKR